MSRHQSDVDELFDVRNYFYIGNYQQCINEAQKIRKATPEVALERDIFTYRAYIAQQKYLVVLDEIKTSSDDKLQPLRLLATYLHDKKRETQDAVLAELKDMLSGNISVDNDILILVAANIYMKENNQEAAFRVLHSSESLEAMALLLTILLKINRLDMAKKKLKEMQDKDDDATLTQLAQAFVNISIGGEKLQEAYYIFQELADKYGATPLLLNGQAVTHLGQSKFDEASVALQEALDKDPNYADTLINMVALSGQNGKEPEIGNRYLTQLRELNPDHPYLRDLEVKEDEVDTLIEKFKFVFPSDAK